MFQRLVRFFLRTTQKTVSTVVKVNDGWDHSGACYVGRFQRNLNEIAQTISEEGRIVLTRFVSKLKCAELYVPGGNVIAQVRVHGSECSPHSAIVTTTQPIRGKMKKIFETNIPLSVRFKTDG